MQIKFNKLNYLEMKKKFQLINDYLIKWNQIKKFIINLFLNLKENKPGPKKKVKLFSESDTHSNIE